MNGYKLGNYYTRLFNLKYDLEKFLAYYKNDVNLHGSTLYENYLYEVGTDPNMEPRVTNIVGWGQTSITEFFFSERFEKKSFIEQIANLGYGPKISARPATMFDYIIQYRLRFLYNISEEITKGEVKHKLLYALTDKIFEHEAILAPLMFFNRQNTETVSVDIFLFCANEIDIEYLAHLGNCEYERAESPIIIEKLTKAQSLYGHYRGYCELFLNKNILSASAFFLAFITKESRNMLFSGLVENRINKLFGNQLVEYDDFFLSINMLLGFSEADRFMDAFELFHENPASCVGQYRLTNFAPQPQILGNFTNYWGVLCDNYMERPPFEYFLDTY